MTPVTPTGSRTEPASAGTARALAAALPCRVVLPGEAEWETARAAWNLAVDQQPAMVAYPDHAGDIAAVVATVRQYGMRVAPQGTGHHAESLGDLSDSVLLRADRLREITVDVDARTVRAGAGVLWSEVTAALAPHGLVGLAGSAPDVGVVGYSLGGGYSWLAREYGLSSSSVTALDVVTGDGRTLHLDTGSEAELFWAMRGGCGNAAIVTAIEFRAYPCPAIYAGMLLFPLARAGEVLQRYRDWTADLDDAASTCARLLRIPGLPMIDEHLRGRAFVGIDGAIDLPADDAAALLAPLRDLRPAVDTFATMPGSALGGIHMDPPKPSPGVVDGLVLTELTDETIEALLEVAGPAVDSPLLAVDLRHLEGAAGRPDRNGGAIDHLPGRFLLYAVGIAPTPAAATAVGDAIDELTTAVAPWTARRSYPNFTGPAATAAHFYPAGVLEQLRAVQQAYDPDRVVRPGYDWAA